ncbi:type II secretion system F family protein [Salinicola endophyticus]|uniref:Type II secretion system F family protein n=1 Tax=Salinicola endophyticus TaxID=1949083 RepID=A0ABY8FKH5_9GAMM|nr:type II secretion system F family protein [Salinicola endophyticus]WFF43308.1 type II secretion system F family protein [Salinicola endophyticus]
MATTAKPPKRLVMHRWQWRGKNLRGDTVSGELIASEVSEVRQELARQKIIVKRITRKTSPFGIGRVRQRDITLFARQLATMIRAGVPLLQACKVVAETLRNPAMRNLVETLGNDISAGASFSQALSRHPQRFDRMFVNMVAAGEQSGALDRMLERLASYREKIDSLKGRIKKALYYPIAVIAVGIGVTALLLIKVVPQFESLFAGFGAELPAFTRFTIDLSELAQAHWWQALLALVVVIVGVRRGIKRSPRFAYRVDQLLLRLPVIGGILDKGSIARFSRTLATTFNAGVPLVEALETAAGATGNRVHQQAIADLREDVGNGQQLAFAMRRARIFPIMAVQMVSIGEEAGDLDTMLDKVADFYEEEVDNQVDALTSLLEPLIIVVLGVLVGGLVASMYLPIFEMGSAI